MVLKAYCFLPKVVFTPLPKAFAFKDGVVTISNDFEPYEAGKVQGFRGSTLTFSKSADVKEFNLEFQDASDVANEANFKKVRELLDKYRGELNEIATLIEGMISINTLKPFPAFEIEHVNIRLSPQNLEDEALIKEGKIHATFGDVGKVFEDAKRTVQDADSMLANIAKGQDRVSALSIYNQASRAEERHEFEIAYSNFFRIIEGYLGDGGKVEAALQKKAEEFVNRIRPNDLFISKLQAILVRLGLPNRAKDPKDKIGIVTDVVLLRHKLMHYNLTHQDKHFYSSLRVDLRIVVKHLHFAAINLLREDIEGSPLVKSADR